MKLELHPEAVKNFNNKSTILLEELSTKIKSIPQNFKNSFKPNIFIPNIISGNNIIGEIKTCLVDYSGSEVAKYFVSNNKQIGLYGDSYQKFSMISENFQKTKGLYDKVSIKLLKDLIFEWIKDKYNSTTDLSMVEYVLNKCEEHIQEFEIWIPIAMLHIQSEIKIGRITLKTITKEILDRWCSDVENKSPSNNHKIHEYFDNEQKVLQGLAASIIKLIAEPQRAFEIALEETEKSIGVLRLFSPSIILPEITSYCTVLGKENQESLKCFILKEKKYYQSTSALVDKSNKPWIIGDSDLSMFKEILDILDNLLARTNITEFQDKVLDSLLLYSRSTLAKNLADKLVYILVALESILLKNENEPIQQNIGERIAFFIGETADERKSIISNLKKAYNLRSLFIHHGHTVEDLETLKEFMLNVWTFFCLFIQNSNRFNSKEQLIESIEKIKLS